MRKSLIAAAVVAAALSAPAQAQGLVRGAEQGAAAGRATGGPIGEIVGGAIGAATGAVNGILGVDLRPRFRTYVIEERRPSYAYQGDLRVGTVLPQDGVAYYEVPREYGFDGYRYTVVNGIPVIVEPGTRRVVEIVD